MKALRLPACHPRLLICFASRVRVILRFSCSPWRRSRMVGGPIRARAFERRPHNPHDRPASGRRPKPSYEGRRVKRKVVVSVNSDYQTGCAPTSYPAGSCDPKPRSQHPGKGVPCGGSNLHIGALMGLGFLRRPPTIDLTSRELKAGLTPLSVLLRREQRHHSCSATRRRAAWEPGRRS